ncbi:MAG TPA: hypothetical protein VHM01_02410 [Alphaproteobacteria bacterium]|nr:hypothetical protein [Alphaproteobacteria bacterium]
MEQDEAKPGTKPDAAKLKEDVPEGAVRSDTNRPQDAEKVEISGARSEREGLPPPKGPLEDEDRGGRRLGHVPSPTPT